METMTRSFITSLRVQRRVVFALLMREVVTRFGRHNLGFLWLFIEPMIFTLGVTALWTATRSIHGSNLPIVAFAVTGYSSVLLWRNMPSRCIGALEPNRTLLHHRSVKLLDVYLARLLLEVAGASMSFVVLTLFFVGIGWMAMPQDVLKIIAAWLLLIWFGFSLAILLATFAEQFEVVEKLWHPATYLFFPLSGAGYIVDALPKGAQDLALYLPMVNGVELLREGYFGSHIISHYDVPYMMAVSLTMSLVGLAQLRKVNRKVLAA
jgi:ABC-2 type transport system permease protein/capsular polysaccharide transport system permease protein